MQSGHRRPFVATFILLVTLLSSLGAAPNRTPTISTIAGDGTQGYKGDGGAATTAELNDPKGIDVDPAGNVFIADANNYRVRKISTTGIITTVAGIGTMGFAGDGGPAVSAVLNKPHDVKVDSHGNLYIADSYNYRIRRVDASGIITTVAGNGSYGRGGDGGAAVSTQLGYTWAVAVDSSDNFYFLENLPGISAGTFTTRIRKVNATGIITSVTSGVEGFSGDGGPALSAKLFGPNGLAVDLSGNLYIADTGNDRIRKVTPDGVISTVAGGGTDGLGDGGPATGVELFSPTSVVVDSSGNLFIADTDNALIRKVDATGIITTVAGNGLFGYNGDDIAATTAKLASPRGIAVDLSGNLYVNDLQNYRIRKVH